PSAAVRPDFFAAFAKPALRNQSTAASISPLFSTSAFLASIMPTPVFSRNSFTSDALISAIMYLLFSCVLFPGKRESVIQKAYPRSPPQRHRARGMHNLTRRLPLSCLHQQQHQPFLWLSLPLRVSLFR